ncbi:CPBP family intramembrane glutamic endopeptidase [Paenibacillus filicis]|uniref:CPBP family intramembrane glutamic endopeptidase n=1 Tax=Paenibacillus filicis TaxID=669464 RepID=A0ABU9DNE4_9BACL
MKMLGLRLFGPTVMLGIGLQELGSVPLGCLLFYLWLAGLPLADRLLLQRHTWIEAVKYWGLRYNRSDTLAGAALGLVILAVILGAASSLWMYLFDPFNLRVLLANWGFSGSGRPLLIVVLIVLNPVLEELYWRGYVLQELKRKMSSLAAIGVSSLFYTVYHLLLVVPIFKPPFGWLAGLAVFGAGLVWGWMRVRSGSLLGAILCHLLADAGIMIVYGLYIA